MPPSERQLLFAPANKIVHDGFPHFQSTLNFHEIINTQLLKKIDWKLKGAWTDFITELFQAAIGPIHKKCHDINFKDSLLNNGRLFGEKLLKAILAVIVKFVFHWSDLSYQRIGKLNYLF
jgi:hypothetical protein